jgi:hypothetical protein
MSAVFCHQTPQVAFGSHPRATCELGDVLFAYVHSPKAGPTVRNAILFQAKASSRQPYPIHRSDADQLRLYVEWPDFVYERSSFLTGMNRSVTPKTPHSGAQYMLIDDRPPDEPGSGLLGLPGTYPVGCCMPDRLLCDHSHLAAELFALFILCTGRPFDDRRTAEKKQDWSQVVWDLLAVGMRKSFNRKNSGRSRTPRTAGDTIAMLDGVSFFRASSNESCSTAADIVGGNNVRSLYGEEDYGPPNSRERVGDMDEPDRGVSIVLLETSERGSEG